MSINNDQNDLIEKTLKQLFISIGKSEFRIGAWLSLFQCKICSSKWFLEESEFMQTGTRYRLLTEMHVLKVEAKPDKRKKEK